MREGDGRGVWEGYQKFGPRKASLESPPGSLPPHRGFFLGERCLRSACTYFQFLFKRYDAKVDLSYGTSGFEGR